MVGLWWPLLLLVVVLVVRRWWAVAAGLAVVTGFLLAALHVGSLPDLTEAGGDRLTVRLQEMPRIVHGQWGDGWVAGGEVVAGAPRATVSLHGDGDPEVVVGDVVTAPMLVRPSSRPGVAASLWIRGDPAVTPDTGMATQVRARMRAVAGDADPGWLLSGMTLGLDQGLSRQAGDAMQAAGLTHLTAVSGANCAVLLLLVDWACGWLRLKKLPRAAVGCVVLGAFVVIVGQQPSVMRASVMAGLSILAGVIGGRRAAAHVLQVAVLVLLLIDPWLAYSVGFMLSVAATAGLILVVDRGPLRATVAAQVATLPILLAIGAEVGLRSIVANLLVTPLAAVIPVLGLASLVVSPIAVLGRALCDLVLRVAGWQSFEPMSWVPGHLGVAIAASVALAVLSLGRRHVVLVAVVLVGAVSVTARLADDWPPRDWWLVACDVGQGDGFVVRDGGRVVVIDTGPSGGAMDGCLDALGVRSIDLLVLTHFHADHVGGVVEVLSQRTVGQVWVSPCAEPAESVDFTMPALAGLPVVTPVPGDVALLGPMELRVVWPQRIIPAGSVPNNASVSFILTTAHGSVALLGDVEQEAQRAMMSTADLDADIVKVPHHGSANFDPELPAAVSARLALVGVGEGNTFGHPSPEALTAWAASGAQVLTTQDNGDIAVRRDGTVAVRGSVDRQ